MAVHFTGAVPSALRNRKRLKEFISDIIQTFGKQPGEITISFCTDEEMLTMNNQYLSHDYYTDILTFDLSSAESKILDADILISIEMLRSNSLKFQTSFIQEMHRVIIHGILHLCGFKDKTIADIRKMRKAESYHLSQYGLK